LADVFFDERSGRVTAFEVRVWAPQHSCRRLRRFPIDDARLVAGVLVVSPKPSEARARRRVH
jgi:hypothetical protein